MMRTRVRPFDLDLIVVGVWPGGFKASKESGGRGKEKDLASGWTFSLPIGEVAFVYVPR